MQLFEISSSDYTSALISSNASNLEVRFARSSWIVLLLAVILLVLPYLIFIIGFLQQQSFCQVYDNIIF